VESRRLFPFAARVERVARVVGTSWRGDARERVRSVTRTFFLNARAVGTARGSACERFRGREATPIERHERARGVDGGVDVVEGGRWTTGATSGDGDGARRRGDARARGAGVVRTV